MSCVIYRSEALCLTVPNMSAQKKESIKNPDYFSKGHFFRIFGAKEFYLTTLGAQEN